ncbi:unknown protein [Seminavis robusta]|uniref:SAP domain-containing protein n=1 Tax=Seminavis robusta TaxID=568900 RepID=A0A9N8EEX8_9STRA|nr:unknown protein [Seminavis robusta]|eukprot:Sro1085_g239580.1 n/a (338) ;mRNA; f:8270-9283
MSDGDVASDASSDDIGARLEKIELAKQQQQKEETSDDDDNDDEELVELVEPQPEGKSPEESRAAAAARGVAKGRESFASDLAKLKKDELKEKFRGLGLKVGGNKTELVERIMGHANTARAEPNREERVDKSGSTEMKEETKLEDKESQPKWGTSSARDVLYKLLLDGVIPDRDKMEPKDVFEKHCKHRPEFKYFQDYKGMKFADKLNKTRKRVEKKKNRSTEDDEFYQHDRNIFPERTQDTHGEPVWAGSKAQDLLLKDLDQETLNGLKPRQLHVTRDEYLEYSLDKFRNKIYQENKWKKDKPGWNWGLKMQRARSLKKPRASSTSQEQVLLIVLCW